MQPSPDSPWLGRPILVLRRGLEHLLGVSDIAMETH